MDEPIYYAKIICATLGLGEHRTLNRGVSNLVLKKDKRLSVEKMLVLKFDKVILKNYYN